MHDFNKEKFLAVWKSDRNNESAHRKFYVRPWGLFEINTGVLPSETKEWKIYSGFTVRRCKKTKQILTVVAFSATFCHQKFKDVQSKESEIILEHSTGRENSLKLWGEFYSQFTEEFSSYRLLQRRA